jgi:Cu/Ag efflux protein CusF
MKQLMVGLVLLFWSAVAWTLTPCCDITAIDAKTTTVTAKETRTGRTFQFKVADQALLRGLKVGQAVHADFTTLKVSVQPDGDEPCCNLVNLQPARTPAR